jgi:xanthine dehydrogenase accessory factor
MNGIDGGLVLVRGAGDLATGCIVRLVRAGYRVAALELARPLAIRRTVSLSEAMYDGAASVEGVRAVRSGRLPAAWSPGDPVPLFEDPEGRLIGELAPFALVDALVAKVNLGTRIDMAPVVVALGPGFVAGRDAHAVVETNRGHDLGKVILRGTAEEDTGLPGLLGGHTTGRVIRAPAPGIVEPLSEIGDRVEPGDAVLSVGGVVTRAAVGGVVRGLIRPGFEAYPGLKVADVDPRCVREHCFSISDKARAVAGGVLEAILMLAPR